MGAAFCCANQQRAARKKMSDILLLPSLRLWEQEAIADIARSVEVDDDMFGGTPQCLRRRFSERRPVGDREAAKFQKAVIS
jgi:hypothetical protein